jgi:predicted CXXCH cytochrome family protein
MVNNMDRSVKLSKRLLAMYWLIVPLIVFTLVTGLSTSLPDIPSASSQNGASGEYIGAETCGLCHRTEYAAWNQSYHNNAGLLNITDGTKYYWLSPEWLHNGSTRLMDEAYFSRCASCHTTGYDSDTGTWPGSDSLDPEEAGAFIGVQCEVCHGPGGEHLDAPIGQKKDVISIDYSYATCAQCHSQPADHSVSAHNTSALVMPRESCMSCRSTQGFLSSQGIIDDEVTLETEGIESISCVACHSPHDAENHAQLRLDQLEVESITELCGTCHTGTNHHPQYDVYIEGPHEKAGVECTSCHGEGTRFVRGNVAEWFNHTFAIYNTFYPFNQTDPLVCGECHDQTWATAQLGVIQETTETIVVNVTEAIHEAEAAISSASNVSGVDQVQIDEATELFEEAELLLEHVEADASSGLHNPEGLFESLSEALQLAGEATILANEAVQEVTASQLSNAQTDLSSVRGILSSTQTYMYVGAIGGIIGGLILGLLVGRKWTS